jgi:probable rRNA maturation factor
MSCNIYQTVSCVGLSKKNIQDIFFIALRFLKKKNREVSVHLIGDQRMKSINKQYRNINKTTDVLAFAIQEGRSKDEKVFSKQDLGDIFVSIPQIKRQAKTQKISYKEEFVRVLMHGLLHLSGYDHKTKSEKKKMFNLQEKLVNKIKISHGF